MRLASSCIIFVFLGIALLLPAVDARAIDNTCYWKVVDIAVVTTFGYYTDTNGQQVWIPMGSTTYVYWGLECDENGEIPGTGGTGGGGYVPMKPKVTLFSIDTTDPRNPKLLVDVASDLIDVAVKLELRVNGSLYASVPIHWDGTYQLGFPSFKGWSDGTKTIQVKACTATNICGTASSSFSRYTQSPISVSSDMSARWLEGDEFKFGVYKHLFSQTYTTSQFAMPELGMNMRRELRKATVTLAWPLAGADVTYNASVQYFASYSGTRSLPPCSGATICAAKCLSRCLDLQEFGYVGRSRDTVYNIAKAGATPHMISITDGSESLECIVP